MQFDGVIFPGQGTQYLGMGKDFVELYEDAKQIFNIANDTLNINLYEICQNDEIKLNDTKYTQPCILAIEIAMYKVLKNYYDFSPTFFAGHSLGEYTALVAAKVIPFDVALKIVHFRGELMQNAIIDNKEGSMVAIIADPLPLEQIKHICSNFKVDIANENSIQQIVLSGYNEDIQATVNQIEKTLANPSMRIVYLAVKSPFHSRYMQKIEEPFQDYLLQFKHKFNTAALTSVISNYDGDFYPDSNTETLIKYLTKQISGSVKWQKNMVALLKHAKHILEVGPAAPLRGFFKSIGVTVQSVTNVKTLNKMFVNI
ncbi:MAG: ACP S-malonyltransferase [Gammaproteobacteria bacterium]|jgi:malonyl CoA-acyl carrier protein transacylase